MHSSHKREIILRTILLRSQYIRRVVGGRRIVRLSLAFVIVLSLFIPVLQQLSQQRQYDLNAKTVALIGKTNRNLVTKFSYDGQNDSWQFNKSAIAQAKSENTTSTSSDPSAVASALQSQVGGDGGKSNSLYAVNLPADASKGITYYDSNTGLSFSLVPNFKIQKGEEHQGRLVYPFGDGGKLVYSAKNNGMKEDIVLSHNIGDQLHFGYTLKLPNTLAARTLNDGSVGIYSADPTLFGNITYGGDADRAKIESARQTAVKDHLLFALPAPVIKQSGKEMSPAASSAQAQFYLNGNDLTVGVSGLSKLNYPLSVDPSVVVTSTSDFASGNNEGNIDFPGDQINRGALTGGSLSGGWAATSSFITARHAHTSVVYNGYIYLLGGSGSGGDLNDVQYAALNSNGTVGTWHYTHNSTDDGTTFVAGFSTARDSFASVAYNGYLYVLGGYASGRLSDVQYAALNSNGTVGSWQATTSLPAPRSDHAAVAYNGYLYVLGGIDSNSNALSDVQYAPINANGTVGAWQATTSFTTARYDHTAVAYNGYLYIFGGSNSNTLSLNDVQYAPINANGTVGAWQATTSFTTRRAQFSAAVYNGYVYIFGGNTDYSTWLNDVQYAPINANGTVGAWQATTSFTNARSGNSSVAYNGYLYIFGGFNNPSYYNDVQVAEIDPAGTLNAMNTGSTINTLGSSSGGSVIYNGYIYYIGGYVAGGGKQTTNVDYAPLNADGSIGTWAATSSLQPVSTFYGGNGTNGVSGMGIVVVNGYIYVIGGVTVGGTTQEVQYTHAASDGKLAAWANATDFPGGGGGLHNASTYNGYIYILNEYGGTASALMYYVAVNSDGTLGTWQTTTSIATAVTKEQSVIYNGYIYVLGGSNGGTYYTSVEYAPINADGTLGAFQYASSMNDGRNTFAAAVVNGYIYALGGTTTGGTDIATTESAPINADGSLGTWTYNTPLPATQSSLANATNGSTIYLLSGLLNGTRTKLTYYAQANNGGSGNFGAWSTAVTTGFANGRYQHASVAYNGYLYVMGGTNGVGTLQDIQYAAINGDGTLGAWQTTTALPSTRSGLAAVAQGGFLYVLGGNGGGTTYLNDVQKIPINSNGSLGASWSVLSSFTTARSNEQVLVYNNYMYILGGNGNGGKLSDVQYAAISADGTLGTWTASGSFTGARTTFQANVYNGYIYVLGGNGSGGPLGDVQVAPIAGNGSVGSWTYSNSLDGTRYLSTSTASNGYLCIYGGVYANAISNADTNDVSCAAIGSSGALGGWQQMNSANQFSNQRQGEGVVMYQGYAYLTGGRHSSTYYNDTQSAPIAVMPRIGHYSKLIDLGSAVNLSSISYNGNLSGGLAAISYRTAGNDGIFGPLQSAANSAGSGSGCVSGTIRYVWLSVTLDGSGNAIFPDVNSNTVNVTDLTVNYGFIHAPPNLRLYQGQYFKDEVLQPLDTCGP